MRQDYATRLPSSARLYCYVALLLVFPLWLSACGGGAGGGSGDDTFQPSDTTAPQVSITAPMDGASLSGTITVSASASDPQVDGQTASGIAGVQFRVDGNITGAEDTAAPYSYSWNSFNVTNGTHTFTAVARDNAGNTTTSAVVTVTVSNVAPPPPPPGAGPTMPSLEDERSTYRKWGWSWTASQEPTAVTELVSGYYVTDIDIHGESEGDDLWTYIQMYRRTGNTVYLNRAKAWARYFKEEYRNSPDFVFDRDSYNLDHLYGWGLVSWYEYTCEQGACDTAALAEAENLGAESEALWNRINPVPGQYMMAEYNLRRGGRHLLLVTRLAEVTKKQRWIDLRDRLINLWMQSPDWNALGMYFHGQYQTDVYLMGDCRAAGVPGCTYAEGGRAVSSFQVGILAEALYQAYRTTGRTDIRDRLVAMARFVDQYGMDPLYQYTGAYFGIVNGSIWHSFSATCGTSCTGVDPVYTTSLVSTLALGYKLSGDRTLYDRAKHFFNRGTKGVNGSITQRAAADNAVGHFMDTRFASASGYFYLMYNKGELQYTYWIFENGGL